MCYYDQYIWIWEVFLPETKCSKTAILEMLFQPEITTIPNNKRRLLGKSFFHHFCYYLTVVFYHSNFKFLSYFLRIRKRYSEIITIEHSCKEQRNYSTLKAIISEFGTDFCVTSSCWECQRCRTFLQLCAEWCTESKRIPKSFYTHLNHGRRYLSVSTKYIMESNL